MRIAFIFSMVTLLWAVPMVHAECTTGFNQQGIVCYDQNGNMCQAYLSEPSGGQDGVHVACGPISCCGQLMTTCWASSPCNHGALKDQKSREQVAALASSTEVLIANCSGTYVLYAPTPKPKAALALRDELR